MALDKKGYHVKISGNLDKLTKSAILKFEEDRALPPVYNEDYLLRRLKEK